MVILNTNSNFVNIFVFLRTLKCELTERKTSESHQYFLSTSESVMKLLNIFDTICALTFILANLKVHKSCT